MDNKLGQLKKSVEVVIAPWKDSPYYQDAEAHLPIFWGQNTLFRAYFQQLDLSFVVELAVGHGRHAELVAKQAGELVVMDVFDQNLEVCRQRLKNYNNIAFKKCAGVAFDGVEDDWASAIYCYDAMVHFSPDIIESYLQDSFRVLTKGGKALFHHSNYHAITDQHYGLNPHARNHMTQALFVDLCAKANLQIIASKVIGWGGVDELDCVTLLGKC